MPTGLLEIIHLGEDWWGQAKTFVERLVGVGNDALHVLIGALLVFVFAAAMRTTLRDIRPGIIVFFLALLNEWHDLRAETWPVRSMQYGEGAKDLLLTIAVPTLLFATVRLWPGLFGPATAADKLSSREPVDDDALSEPDSKLS